MIQRIQLMTPEGTSEYWSYDDNREMAREYHAGNICDGMQIVYRNMICRILGIFTDEDGAEMLEMLFEAQLPVFANQG